MKSIVILICVSSLMLLSGCNKSENPSSQIEENLTPSQFESINDFEGVSMNVVDDSASSTGLTVLFENDSDKSCIYGSYYLLEKKISDKWYEVPVVFEGDYGFDDVGFPLEPSQTSEWTVEWEWLYGILDTGDYRIVKDILDFRGTGDFDTYYLAAEFSVE
ncbi:MAG TPA: immunoglobulin-like domain-containing protein [Fusibacter sp.]|nr:immunoglobulin-like domain-containing protein [Fusibacter sp.]